MCRHLGAQANRSGGQPGQETKRNVEYLLADMADGLDLSRKLLLLADGPWEECGHGGRLPIRGILRDCAHKIVTETMRCRMDLEARGEVHFGAVMIEGGDGSDGPDPATGPLWDDPPPVLIYPRQPAGLSGSHPSPAGQSQKTGPSPLETLRRLCASFLARNTPEGSRMEAVEPRQGGA